MFAVELKVDPRACRVIVESVIKAERRARRKAWLERKRDEAAPWVDLGGEG